MVALAPSISVPSPASDLRVGRRRSSAGKPQDLAGKLSGKPSSPSPEASAMGAGMSGQEHVQGFAKRAQSWAYGAVDVGGLAGFLRAQHPVKTAAAVEGQTGIPAASVRKWLEGRAFPGCEATFRLLQVYGLPLAAACVRGCAWLDEAILVARDKAIEAQKQALAAESARIAAILNGNTNGAPAGR